MQKQKIQCCVVWMFLFGFGKVKPIKERKGRYEMDH